MSEEMNALIQLIRKPAPKPLMEPVEPSEDQSFLIDRMSLRRWKKEELNRLLAKLQQLHGELAVIKHVRKCRLCQGELQLSVERYMGTRGPWWINLEGEMGYPEIYEEEDSLYKDAPRPDSYKIGSYWRGCSKDTIRFIMDRMRWAEHYMKEDVEISVDYYVELENWNLEDSPPILMSYFDWVMVME